MAFASVISPDQARLNGEQVWELILTNWGNQGALKDADSNQYGNFPGTNILNQFTLPPAVALAIAPDSYLDLTWMYPLVPFIPGTKKTNTAYQRLLSQDRPWLGGTSSPLIFTAGPSFLGPQTTQALANQPERIFFDTVVDEAGAVIPFGTALDGGTGAIFIQPRLNVLMYLRDPPASIPKRAPFGDHFLRLSPAGDNIVRVWPVMGRRHIRVIVWNNIGGAVNVRLTGVDTLGLPIFAFGTPHERLLAGPVALGAGALTTFNLDTPITDYLVLRANGAGNTLFWNCEAID